MQTTQIENNPDDDKSTQFKIDERETVQNQPSLSRSLSSRLLISDDDDDEPYYVL
jgi:hypothetical protein